MNTIVIITEKPKVSSILAKAILPKDLNLEDCLIRDSFQVHRPQRDNPNHTEDFVGTSYYKNLKSRFRSRPVQSLKFKALSTQSDGKATKSRFKPARFEEELDEKFQSNYSETISYYAITVEDTLYLICDTSGVLLTTRFQNRHEIVSKYSRWSDIKAYSQPSLPSQHERSSLIRTAWFEYVLVDQCCPCTKNSLSIGKPLNIVSVLSATDYDIAGQFIFHSIIEHCNALLTKKESSERLHDDLLGRIDLSDPAPEILSKKIKHPLQYEKSRALAGKLRSDVDNVYGLLGSVFQKIQKNHPQYNHWFYKTHWKGKPTHPDRMPTLFKFGRVQSLSLAELIKEEQNVRSQPPNLSAYLLFPGKLTSSQLAEIFKNKHYILTILQTQKTSTSHAQWLANCKQSKIGTHTTRYTQLKRLINNKYAYSNNGIMFPTVIGRRVFKVLDNFLLNGQNGLKLINEKLIEEMATIESLPYEDGMKRYNAFMHIFYSTYKNIHIQLEQSKELEHAVHSILTDLVDEKFLYPVVQRPPQRKSPINLQYPREDQTTLIGLNDKISKDTVLSLYNNPDKKVIVSRYEAQQHEDITEKVRRICCLDKGTNIDVVGITNPQVLKTIDEENWTVFKSSLTLDELEFYQANQDDFKMQSISNLPIDKLLLEQQANEDNSPHEPIYMNDVSRRNLKGESGTQLAVEYMLPWSFTTWCRDVVNSDQACPAGFTLDYLKEIKRKKRKKEKNPTLLKRVFGNFLPKPADEYELERIHRRLNFEVVHRYEIGKVHNFESLLETMSDKYGFEFDFTANLAEEMYLS